MATANRGQIAHVHTPTATRKRDQPRDSTMATEYASAGGGPDLHFLGYRVGPLRFSGYRDGALPWGK
jgi:hypothetical protein